MASGTQLSVTVKNKPGQLAKLGAVLARAKVNIEAISVLDSSEVGVVRLVTSANQRARKALEKAGMNVVRQPVLIVKLPNEPGALGTAARRLAAAKVNIEFVYGSAARAGEPSTMVIGVSDIRRAAKVQL